MEDIQTLTKEDFHSQVIIIRYYCTKFSRKICEIFSGKKYSDIDSLKRKHMWE